MTVELLSVLLRFMAFTHKKEAVGLYLCQDHILMEDRNAVYMSNRFPSTPGFSVIILKLKNSNKKNNKYDFFSFFLQNNLYITYITFVRKIIMARHQKKNEGEDSFYFFTFQE